MFLEVFAKERLVGEVQLLRDLLDAHRRIFQQDAHLQRDVVVNPFVGGTTADLLDGLGEVFRRDAHLLGIPADAALCAEIALDEADELCEDADTIATEPKEA